MIHQGTTPAAEWRFQRRGVQPGAKVKVLVESVDADVSGHSTQQHKEQFERRNRRGGRKGRTKAQENTDGGQYKERYSGRSEERRSLMFFHCLRRQFRYPVA